MYVHFIIMASAYHIHKRIALHYCHKNKLNMDGVRKDLDYIHNACGKDAPISLHFLQTDGESFESIQKEDKFFDGVLKIEDVSRFTSLVIESRCLHGIDIARYILSKIPCTHLKLEKLVYFCYADYLCSTGSPLFEDKIYSYQYGPVVLSVYSEFRGSGASSLENDTEIFDREGKMLPFRSKIFAAKDGVSKVSSIDKTLEKYGNLSSHELVSLTHREDSPWSYASGGVHYNREISDFLIEKYHKNECI